MLCYKDKCFCSYWKECSNGNECDRKLTDYVFNEADKKNIPVSQFISKPKCFMKIKKRDILFRGKTTEGKWVEGFYYEQTDISFILHYEQDNSGNIIDVHSQVISETVSQFTGMFDKNRVKIFEGDIVLCVKTIILGEYIIRKLRYNKKENVNINGFVEYRKDGFFIVFKDSRLEKHNMIDSLALKECEVVGNIYDNLELLK